MHDAPRHAAGGHYNTRLNIDDGAWVTVRFVGEGLLEGPGYVTCSESIIAVSETHNIHNNLQGSVIAHTSDTL